MRVIAGKARRLPLKTIEGLETRPTTDRIKETLFNILAPYLADCRFLDLFAGSGAIGIEALSRSAAFACFVEQMPKAADCIEQNLAFTHLEKNAQVYRKDVLSALRLLEQEHKPFDIIFMDPPYGKLLERRVLEYLSDSCLADENTMIVVEASLETSFDDLGTLPFHIYKEKIYKTNKHVFIARDAGTYR